MKISLKNSKDKLVKCATEVARLHRVSSGIHSCTQNRPSPKVQLRSDVVFTPSLGRVRRPCRGLEKFFPPVLQRCYGCSFDAQEIVHTGHGMLGCYCFFFFFFFFFIWSDRCLPKVS